MRPETRRHVRQRPHRLARACYRGEVAVAYTACVANRKELFTDTAPVKACVRFLGMSALANSCVVPVYSFMPDHVHILLRGTNPEADTWKAMVDFKQHSGFWMREQRLGASWQRGFYDHVLRNDESIRDHIRYIADNPVRKGLVETWEDYPFTGSLGVDLVDDQKGQTPTQPPTAECAG